MDRRNFIKSAAPAVAAPAIRLNAQSPNEKLGVAMIGVGTRGIYLLERVQEAPNVEIRHICDLYDSNLNRAAKTAFNKKAVTSKDWEKVVESKDIDAVVIATPDFWHATMAVRAAQLKKHVYVEKGLCRTLEEAKAIRKAVRENKVTIQLGHDINSSPEVVKAREIYKSGRLGKTPLIRTYIDRTNPWPEWQFYTAYNINQPPADATAQTIDWERFQANSGKKVDFDRERFFRWRCWWEYGTGIAGDLMSHAWDTINGIAAMGIPESVTAQGDLYFWKQDRDVPDMWHVFFDYPKQELLVTFDCTFHNRHHGTANLLFGRDATMEMGRGKLRVYDAEWKPDYYDKLRAARKKYEAAGLDPDIAEVEPSYVLKKGEVEVSNHVRNWVDSIRSGEIPRCGMDRAWQEAVTIVMAVESHFRERKVKWDPVNEQII